MRSISYVTAAGLDAAHRHADAASRAAAQARVDLMTPVVKGWCTEISQVLTSIGVQVHGGMGYVEETGVAQYLRDARITTIYEGTTGIQANDLVGRKIQKDGGASLGSLITDLKAADAGLARHPALAGVRKAHAEGCKALEQAVTWLMENQRRSPQAPAAAAYHLLMLLGTVTGGWQLARAAVVASERLARDPADRAFYKGKIATARFYAGQVMPQATAHSLAITTGSDALLELTEADF
jgi:hypothetical protein